MRRLGWPARTARARSPHSSSPTARPLVFAHRGASSELAEHTLEAYAQAIRDGADGFECDVRLTADGHLVCVHDRRIDRTSNGRGLVSTSQLSDLESLDWSSWKRPWRELDDEDDAPLAASGVLTLDRLLGMIRDFDRRVELLVEAKHPTRYSGLVEQRLVEVLDRYGWARPKRPARSPVQVMSFSRLSLRRVLELAPALETVYLMDRVPLRFRDGSLPLGASVAGIDVGILRAHPGFAGRVRSHGHQVYVWVANDDADIDLCNRLAADGVITDRPRRAIERLTGRHGD